MAPFYTRLPNVAGVGVERTADTIGAALAAGAAAGVLAHAAATGLHQIRTRRQLAAAGAGAPPPPPAPPSPPSTRAGD